MPRRKQGQSTVDGTLKKNNNSGKETQNELQKQRSAKGNFVFKIKKTLSSTTFNSSPTKNEREHVDSAKSLNDTNSVQPEINNNVIVNLEQDRDRIATSEHSANANCTSEGTPKKSFRISRKNAEKTGSNKTEVHLSVNDVKNDPLQKEADLPSEKMQRKVEKVSKTSVITANSAFNISRENETNKVTKPTKSDEKSLGSSKELETEKQEISSSSQMSGVAPSLSVSNGCKEKEPHKLNYRISTSVIESKSSSTNDHNSDVFKAEEKCQLPSSVYGTSASNIENVLSGLQFPDKARTETPTANKISFLQEILEQDLSRKSYSSSSELNSVATTSTLQDISSKNGLKYSYMQNIHTTKDADLQENITKLKLSISDSLSFSDDSSSSALSSDSQRITKFPKTSSNSLEQHISKLISENAAIVRPVNPVLSKRYLKQTSLINATSTDLDSKRQQATLKNRSVEEKFNGSNSLDGSYQSKLQTALLGGYEAEYQNIPNAGTPYNLTTSTKGGHFFQFNSATPTTTCDPYSKVASLSEKELRGSAIKSLLSLKEASSAKYRRTSFENDYSTHPQNPEGSIIKDLLLKNKTKDVSSIPIDENGNMQSSFRSLGMTDKHHVSNKINSFPYKCPHCFTELPDKYNLDKHLLFCKDVKNHYRASEENIDQVNMTSKHNSQISKFQYGTNLYPSDRTFDTERNLEDINDGIPILKKQLLLPLSKSPPLKKKKLNELDYFSSIIDLNKSIPQKSSIEGIGLSPHRSQSVHLFGGEVQIMEGSKTKKMKIKTSIPGVFSQNETKTINNNYFPQRMETSIETEKDITSLPAVVVTIAQPVHNSGGTVTHVTSRRLTTNMSPIVTLSNEIMEDHLKGNKIENSSPTIYKKRLLLYESQKSVAEREVFSSENLINSSSHELKSPSITISPPNTTNLKDFRNAPASTTDLSPISFKLALSPGYGKPFYSPIFSTSDKSIFNQHISKNTDRADSQLQCTVPSLTLTPSSPKSSSQSEVEAASSSTSLPSTEPAKKFLAPTRPTSLPLKKKPFTMVGSTLISPETPRPKKSCMQLYLNGHAYTYLGLKCSTRSTYCCIYRPQPMFVLQETNPKLSMYSNWQVVPAKEELCGLTPGQMISFYCSKQCQEANRTTTTAKLGEPLTFTHSSYWTFRTQEHGDQKDSADANSVKEKEADCSQGYITEKLQESSVNETSTEAVQYNITSGGVSIDKDTQSHSTDESNPRLDTDNTLSDVDGNNSDEDDDDDCQDDGTESLTDSSQPQPPKRVKIFEGGFKSNEDYTYVRGRGRGKYVCEECGIRCKKPSMLKKHIRTHTDLRPYKCRHCSFAFKTKGNLTKHMKSKAHHKKCTELGIIPVPTTTDDSQIDEEALAKQEQIERKKKNQLSDGEDADDDDDSDSDESEDDCESDASSMMASNHNQRTMANGHSKNPEYQTRHSSDNYNESSCGTLIMDQTVEHEAARGLLHLSSIGEPSQWSRSTGDLSDVTSGETDLGPASMMKQESFLMSPQYTPQLMPTAIQTNLSGEHWTSSDNTGHRPRSYSADTSMTSGKELLAKYRLIRGAVDSLGANSNEPPELPNREQYGSGRRYSISVTREARMSTTFQAPKWPDSEFSDQPMDLSVSRDFNRCKQPYASEMSLMPLEPVPTSSIPLNFDACLSDTYQLKPLPNLSPQALNEYEATIETSNAETPLLPAIEEQASYSSTSRLVYHMPNTPDSSIPVRKEMDASEDPLSPEMSEYAACSPVSPQMLDDSQYYYAQEGMGQTPPEEIPPTSRFQAEFMPPTTTSSSTEEGKCVCRICNKIFAKSSHLRLHVNIHYFERPFRCDNCAVSFRTKGHLQKHKRSVSHYNKVNMNLTFGTPSVDNPRPFKCGDCKIAFRIHGHLAKHLRSKMHIMKLECLGKLPFGMYAEMERSGVSLNEIDTTDCNNSLESLQVMAQKLYQRDPRRMRWQGPEQQISTEPLPVVAPAISTALPVVEPLNAFSTSCTTTGITIQPTTLNRSSEAESDVKRELSEVEALQRAVSSFPEGDISTVTQYTVTQPVQQVNSTVRRPDIPDESSVSLNRSGTCHICGRLFKSAKFLQVHLYCDHSSWSSSASEVPPQRNSASAAKNMQECICDLCGRQYPNQKVLQQHLLTHAQPRPFVCEICDAGFTSSVSLIAHQATHQTSSSAATFSET